MRNTRITLVLLGLLALGVLSTAGGPAEALTPSGFGNGAEPAPLATKVKTFLDCQEIAPCERCRPVYKCRSCKYQKVCGRGFCEWRDVCVWGPARKVLPPGARIIRVR